MIYPTIPMDKYPGLAYDGAITFSGLIQTYFTKVDITGQNIGFSRRWNDAYASQCLNDYILRILPIISHRLGSQIPMHEYTEDHFAIILEELERIHHYASSTLRHYEFLLETAYMAGVEQGLYDANILLNTASRDLDSAVSEQTRAKALTRIRKSFNETEELQILLWACSLDPLTANGEDIGLMLMYFLGIRDNEACGASYGDLQVMPTHPDMAVLAFGNTTGLSTNQLKASGKTANAPRQLPILNVLFHFFQVRKKMIQHQIDTGILQLPEDIDSIDLLPLACVGTKFTVRAQTYQLSKRCRDLFAEIGISSSTLSELHKTLLSKDFQSAVPEEKSPTSYLMRRNAATRQYHMGFSWETIQYWMGHDIESPILLRNFFSDEETLYDLGRKYYSHPIFEILDEIMNTEPCGSENRSGFQTEVTVTANEVKFFDIEAKDANDSVSIIISSKSPFSVTQVSRELSVSSNHSASILHELREVYWRKFYSLRKK